MTAQLQSPVLPFGPTGTQTLASQFIQWEPVFGASSYVYQADNGPWQETTRAHASVNCAAPGPHSFRIYAKGHGGTSGQSRVDWETLYDRGGRIGATGTFRVLAVPVTWSGADAISGNAASWDAFLAEIAAAFDEYSYGRCTLEFTRIAPVTIPVPSNPSATSQLLPPALAAAAAAGYDPATFDKAIWNFTASASFGAFDTSVGGHDALVEDYWDPTTNPISYYYTAHELGHGVGFDHCHFLSVGGAPYNAAMFDAAIFDSGDTTHQLEYAMDSFMGGSAPLPGIPHPAAAHKLGAGWLQTASVVVPYADSTHTLDAIELAAPANPQALIFTANGRQFTVEVRADSGLDATITTGPQAMTNAFDGVLIHVTDNSNTLGIDPYLLDAHPKANQSDFPSQADEADAAFGVGESLTVAGVTVTCTARTATTATVSIAGIPQPPDVFHIPAEDLDLGSTMACPSHAGALA